MEVATMGEHSGVSALILTLNEELEIRECIETLQWADEVLVVDCGSTDSTCEIAKAMGARVMFRPWPDDYAEQRNFAASVASNNWVICIDADERVTPGLGQEILSVLERPAFSSYSCPMRNYVYSRWMRHSGLARQWHTRVYDRRKCAWQRGVHEVLECPGGTGHLREYIEHYAYRSPEEILEKVNKYTTMEARALFVRGKGFSLFRLLYESLGIFVYKYCVQLGVLDGVPGLVWAASLSYYRCMKWVKLGYYWFDSNGGNAR